MKCENEKFSSLVELLRHRAENQGLQRAFTFLTNGEEEGEILTFAGLDQKARDIAVHLHKSIPEAKGSMK